VSQRDTALCGEIHQSAFDGDFRAVFHSGHHFLVQHVLKYILLDWNGHSVYKQNRHDPNTRCPLFQTRRFHRHTQFTPTNKCTVKTKINQQNAQINSGLIYYWSITPTCFGPSWRQRTCCIIPHITSVCPVPFTKRTPKYPSTSPPSYVVSAISTDCYLRENKETEFFCVTVLDQRNGVCGNAGMIPMEKNRSTWVSHHQGVRNPWELQSHCIDLKHVIKSNIISNIKKISGGYVKTQHFIMV